MIQRWAGLSNHAKCHNVSYRTRMMGGCRARKLAAEDREAAPCHGHASFYEDLKQEGFVIYPGKVSEVDTFRIGTIGEVCPDDVDRLADAVVAHRRW